MAPEPTTPAAATLGRLTLAAPLDTASPVTEPLSARFVRDPSSLIAHAHELTAAPPPEVDAIQRELGRLASVPAEVLGQALDELLVGPAPAAGLQGLAACGALTLLLPEVAALIGFHRSSPAAHKDLWSHTLTVLERTANDADLRWIALCHDLGKIATRALDADGRLGFHRHEAVGARLFVGIGARLAFPAERSARIAFVIEHHAKTNQYDATWTDRALRRLVRTAGPHLPLMIAFSAADWTTRRAARAERIQRNIAELKERLAALDQEPPERALPRWERQRLAQALLEESGQLPGPWLQALLAQAEDLYREHGDDPRAIARRCLGA